jgi:hypothetical protein
MASKSHADGRPRVNAFNVEGAYLFRHYFDGDAVFARLRRYYEPDQYRFAVPASEFDGVRRFLDGHGYRLEPVSALDPYVVLVRKYTAHPENIFKQSVLQRSHGDYTLFLLTDRTAVDRAVEEGAVRLADSPISVQLGEQRRLSAV